MKKEERYKPQISLVPFCGDDAFFLLHFLFIISLRSRPLVNPGLDHLDRAVRQVWSPLRHPFPERGIGRNFLDQVAPGPVPRDNGWAMLASLQELSHRPNKEPPASPVATVAATLLEDRQNVGTEPQRILGSRHWRLHGRSLRLGPRILARSQEQGNSKNEEDLSTGNHRPLFRALPPPH
jgi:hypothetical protein